METMQLSPRLACLAAQIPRGARLADVGTDHGKLPIALMQQGFLASAIGSDIRSGPLSHAEKNALGQGAEISLRLAAGLDAVQAEECDTVSIAGMGGQTIADILAAAPWTGEGKHLLLLQPMTMIPALRQWLWAHGYRIERETLCREEQRLYLVLAVRGGGELQEVPQHNCFFSPALLAASGAREYIQLLLRRECRALSGMEKSSMADPKRLAEQRQTVSSLERALEELK